MRQCRWTYLIGVHVDFFLLNQVSVISVKYKYFSEGGDEVN